MNIGTRGILFKEEMIRALLNSKPDVWPAEPIDLSQPFKWQTRRIIKETTSPEPFSAVCFRGREWRWTSESGKTGIFMWNNFRCPMKIGDVFYAKETFKFTVNSRYIFKADVPQTKADEVDRAFGNWKPSIFMPKAAARLWFTVKNIRVERVNAISGDDARAEGVHGHDNQVDANAIGRYRELWNSINENKRFEKGPFVFVYDIARISRP